MTNDKINYRIVIFKRKILFYEEKRYVRSWIKGC